MKVIEEEGRVLCVGFRCLLWFVCLKIHLLWQIPLKKKHPTPNGTMSLYTLVMVAACVVPRQQNCLPCSLDTPQLHRLCILRPLYLWGCCSWMAAGLLNILPRSPSPHSRILKLTSTLNCLSTGLTFFLLVNRSFFLQNSRYNLQFSGFLPFSTSSVIQWHKKYETNGCLLTMLTAVQVFLSL